MRIGSLVMMKDDPWQIMGIIIAVERRSYADQSWSYKVNWMDDLCDWTYVDKPNLEVICE